MAGQGGYHPLTKADLQERLKEIQERIKQFDRRAKALGDLKRWLSSRKLDYLDLAWMSRQMKPKRADKPVQSKKPLQPRAMGLGTKGGKHVVQKGDPEFRAAIRAARIKLDLDVNQLGAKIGTSGASISNWEAGRYVPTEKGRVKILKALGLPPGLGAEATKAMLPSQGGAARVGNGRATA